MALAVAVLVTDATANGWALYGLDAAGGATAPRVGQAVITVMALAACTAAPALWRWCGRGHPVRGDHLARLRPRGDRDEPPA